MMGAEEPCIQVAKDNVDHREVRVGNGVVTTHSDTLMGIPGGLQWVVPNPTVSTHNGPGFHGRQNKGRQRFLLPVRDNLKPEAPRNNTPAMSAFGGLRFCLSTEALSLLYALVR